MTSRRLPSHLLCVLLWCGVWGVWGLRAATGSPEPAAQSFLAAVGGVHLVLLLGLWTLRSWARWLGAGAFLAVATYAAYDLAVGGLTLMRAGQLCFNLWAAAYLCSGTTRDLFRGPGVGSISVQSAAPLGVLLLAVAGVAALQLPRGVTLVLGGLLAVTYLVFEERLHAWLAVLLAPRPAGLDADQARAFRAARRARLRGRAAECARLLKDLPGESRAVGILRGLLQLDLARRDPGLAGVILHSEHAPNPARDRLLAERLVELPLAELEARVAQRAELIEALLEDADDARSCFALELGSALGALSGEHFLTNPEQGYRRWWNEQGEHQQGPAALSWLVARCWRAERYRAGDALAERVAAERADEEGALSLREAAGLARAFAEASTLLTDPTWREREQDTLALAVGLSDGMGWLLLDSPYLEKRGVVRLGERFRARQRLISTARQAWERYPSDAGPTVRWLLHLLTDAPGRLLRRRQRFDRYWARCGPRRQEHEAAFLAGVRAATEQMWEVAAASFARASELEPARTTPRYNRAACLLQAGEHEAAEELLEALATSEPDESFWWLRLGDCRRQRGDTKGALAAYDKAVSQEGLGGRVALRLGLTLVADGQVQAAERFLDAALEQADEPGLTEQLASVLESEGAYDLARRYHHKAFLQQLEQKDSFDFGSGEEGLEPPELV